MKEMGREHPKRRFYAVTLISDFWHSYDWDCYLWLGTIKQTARAVLDRAGFSGWLGMVEVQTLDAAERMMGRILLPNCQIIGWSDDPSFSMNKAEERMLRSKGLTASVGKTVEVKELPAGSQMNLAAYMMKGSSTAKYRKPERWHASGFKLARTQLQPISAVRQLDVLSHCELHELMFAGGDGADIRSELKRLMDELVRTVANHAWISVERASRFWEHAYRRFPLYSNYAPVHVERSIVTTFPIPAVAVTSDRLAGRAREYREWRKGLSEGPAAPSSLPNKSLHVPGFVPASTAVKNDSEAPYKGG
jgi:hypothetical protein